MASSGAVAISACHVSRTKHRSRILSYSFNLQSCLHKDLHAGYAATRWRNLLSNLPKTKLHYGIEDTKMPPITLVNAWPSWIQYILYWRRIELFENPDSRVVERERQRRAIIIWRVRHADWRLPGELMAPQHEWQPTCFNSHKKNEKSAQRHKHCAPKFFAPPQTPCRGAQDRQNLISWRWSLRAATDLVRWRSMHAISSYCVNRHRPLATNTNTQTGPITIHCAAS